MANCNRNGCSGEIVDGICEDCGKPQLGKSLLATVEAVNLPENMPVNNFTNITNRFTASSRRGITKALAYPTARTTQVQGSRRLRTHTGGSTARRNALGGGLISLPPMPSLDPMTLLMAKPEIPAHRRICPNSPAHCCAKNEVNLPIEQRHPVLVSLNKGFCGNCGAAYDYTPALKPGDMVAKKYEVKGCIAFGGLGWIYLAFDAILSRWVILKGLLNAKDEESAAAAVAERQYLAAVKHPKIVSIYDFIVQGNEGYIVMEYVGGKTIQSIRKEKGPLPVEEAISYIMGILPAFSYLHEHGYVYCDMKPENLMLEGDDVKLVDLGAMRKINDIDGAVYGTMGYMALELCQSENGDMPQFNPSEVSDLYTLGRSLAQLIMNFSMREHEFDLPTPEDQPILAEYESLYRFLLRATHPSMDERFQTAQEMQDQLLGVLREIVAMKSNPIFVESKVFTSDNLIDKNDLAGFATPEPRTLPSLKADTREHATSELMRLAAISEPEKKIEAIKALQLKYPKSIEIKIRLIETYILANQTKSAQPILQDLETLDPFDWRVSWFRGLAYLMNKNSKEAIKYFETTYFEMPGELAPKLALAFAHEQDNQLDRAAFFYELVTKVDPSFMSACFGLSRCLAKSGLLIDCAKALYLVPASHTLHSAALSTLAKNLISDESKISPEILKLSANAVQEILSDGTSDTYYLAGELLFKASKIITKSDKFKILGFDSNKTSLLLGAESLLRKAAKVAPNKDKAIFYVEKANYFRPVTLL